MRKILFSPDSECLQELVVLLAAQPHKTQVLWALDCALPYLAHFEKQRPGEGRPRAVLEIAEAWARGRVKMPEAKRAIHAAHSAAAEVGDKTRHDASVLAAGRAIGHAAATVHVGTHAPGLVYYGLTSKVYAAAAGETDAAVKAEVARLYERLLYWQEQAPKDTGPWAAFLG